MGHKLIPLKKEALKEAGIPLSPWTFRDWRKRRKNLHLFTRVGRRVFINMKEWQKFLERGKGK